jgi:hypothetical protein
MLIGYDDLRRKMKKGIKAKVRVIIVRKKVNKTPYFEKNEMEKSPQSKNKTKQNKTKQNKTKQNKTKQNKTKLAES